ncbi:MAG: hypothetical protein GY870_13955 [archaeon]|nr:hypothetical protein [archaeon]
MSIVANISDIALIAGFFSGIGAIFISAMGFRLGWLYKKKNKSTAGLLLTLSVIFWAISAYCSTYVYYTTGRGPNPIPELTKIVQIIMYSCVFIATMFTYLFASLIFFKPKKWFTILYIIVGIICLILLFDPNTALMPGEIYENIPGVENYQTLLLSDFGSIILLIYVGVTTVSLLIITLKLRKRTPKKLDKLRMLYAAMGQLMILITFTCDALASVFQDTLFLYALFLWLTWIVPNFAVFFYYAGWTVPAWVQRRAEKS